MFGSVGFSGCLGLWNLRRAPLQRYRATRTPPTCIVHHRPALCTIVHNEDLLFLEVGVIPNIFHFLVVHMEHTANGHFLSVNYCNFPDLWAHSENARVVHKGTNTEYSHMLVHNIHTNQGSKCSSVSTYTLVHNVALYWLRGAHDDLSCTLPVTT